MDTIPDKNPAALIGYYLGVLSLIPCLGCVFAVGAIICGILGAVAAKRNPKMGGMAHAIAAISLGIGGPLFWIAMWFLWSLF